MACFSIGLVVFAYSSSQVRLTWFSVRSLIHLCWQHRGVTTVTTVLSAFTYMGVAIVLSWFGFARHRFIQERDKQDQLQRSSSMHPSTDETSSRRPTIRSPTISFSGKSLVSSPTIERKEPSVGGEARRNPSGGINTRNGGQNRRNSVAWAPDPVPETEKRDHARRPLPGAHDPFRSYNRISNSQIDYQLDDDSSRQQPPGAMSPEDAWIDETGIRHMSFSPDGKMLAICGGRTSSSTWAVDVGLQLSPVLLRSLLLGCLEFFTHGSFNETASASTP